MLRRLLFGLMLGLMLQPVWAAEDESGASGYVGYIELKPFVANFGGAGPLRFIKCEITLQVGSEDGHHAVNYHLPSIRNDIVFLLSAQDEAALSSVEAQAALAKEALAQVQTMLREEEGAPLVTDLFFTSLVIQ
ncbi:flagellar basal body-associated FliL family protein [Marinobacterium sedimentorum]|uniref:flagellar basal body-associated FliL family protein n=1 Tax=Marinobacterium sedimentorum TaxID=2927804 RepID=UPI0020C7101A|nr:flagellar basal body-associated FliL family protein [Marinobacterium sedimentorum]MCP8688986.1 flagellar basal body-associated FliL family protein [Marinobacterium sedimentorum]